MLQKVIWYCLRHPGQAVHTFASDPVEALISFQERYAYSRQRNVPPELYQADSGWERRMHELIGLSLPCVATSEFWDLWQVVIGELKAKGIRVGPNSFKGWNDGDAAFVRAIWCLTRHLRPKTVVETGVAHGVSSRFILEALKRNGDGGHLWSIDHPPLEQELHDQIGIAVSAHFSSQWTYIRGSSKRRLPTLLSQLGQIDLFIHDSLHSELNVRFEMNAAHAALRAGGAIVVDDIDANWAFNSFVRDFPAYPSLICEAEPLHPDLRRFNNKGLFGIVLKEQSAVKH